MGTFSLASLMVGQSVARILADNPMPSPSFAHLLDNNTTAFDNAWTQAREQRRVDVSLSLTFLVGVVQVAGLSCLRSSLKMSSDTVRRIATKLYHRLFIRPTCGRLHDRRRHSCRHFANQQSTQCREPTSRRPLCTILHIQRFDSRHFCRRGKL
jgi:hypothetical protein